MIIPLLVLGLVLIALGIADLLKTVVNAEGGGGAFTSRMIDKVWSLVLAFHRRRPWHRLLRLAGLGLILATILTWVVLLWLGWSLVFLSDPNAVVASNGGQPADGWSRVYFAGYTLFTLGNGEYQPGSSGWQITTTFAALMGLGLIGLGVTYLVPVIQAVGQKRQLAALIAALGATPALLLERAWDGESYRGLDPHLPALTASLASIRQAHFSYPTLHYFHSLDASDAFAPRLAALDEALSVLLHAVPEEKRPSRNLVEPLRHVIRSQLATLELGGFISAADEQPPPLDLGTLRTQGLHFLDHDSIENALAMEADRRRLLRGFVEHDGWDWTEAVCMTGDLPGGAHVAVDPATAGMAEDDPQAA